MLFPGALPLATVSLADGQARRQTGKRHFKRRERMGASPSRPRGIFQNVARQFESCAGIARYAKQHPPIGPKCCKMSRDSRPTSRTAERLAAETFSRRGVLGNLIDPPTNRAEHVCRPGLSRQFMRGLLPAKKKNQRSHIVTYVHLFVNLRFGPTSRPSTAALAASRCQCHAAESSLGQTRLIGGRCPPNDCCSILRIEKRC